MESGDIKLLLEKYWQAETSLEEEQLLMDYFHGDVVAPELEVYRPFFDWIEVEANMVPSASLEARILDRVEKMAAAETDGNNLPRKGKLLGFPMRYAIAAAMLLCVATLFLVTRIGGGRPTAPGAAPIVGRGAGGEGALAKDTYDDPEKALAVVRQALMKVSIRMNEGRQITQKNIQVMDHSWQAAVSN